MQNQGHQIREILLCRDGMNQMFVMTHMCILVRERTIGNELNVAKSHEE